MISIPKLTLPETDETPTISNDTVLLLGVKTTLNKLAVKLELSWHVFREEDLSSLSAEAYWVRERMEVIAIIGDSSERRMMAIVDRQPRQCLEKIESYRAFRTEMMAAVGLAHPPVIATVVAAHHVV